MMPLNYALAAVLLATPAEPAEPPDTLDCLVTTRPAVRNLALAWEILDPREARYVLTRGDDFASDLKLLRRRYADLKDAPPLYDCMRFPDRALVNDVLAFNRAYKQHLEARQAVELWNAWELHRAIEDTEDLYKTWDLVRDTRTDYYYVTVRRTALMRLRDRIGWQAYESGVLPPHVPVWRFDHIP